jgi:acyl transferase domain-containing protein
MRDRSLDVAVTGLYARLPGPEDLDKWWAAVCAGETLTTRFTAADLSAMGVPDHVVTDPAYVPVRGRIDDAEKFDAELFGIGPREAQLTDPQHRLMLEASWAALEDAGRDPRADTSRTAVFASSSPSRYLARILADPGLDAQVVEAAAVGGGRDFMATRLAYRLGLEGPAISVLTACSSSLVAVHLAAQALNSGDCDQAVVVAASVGYPQAGHTYVRGGIMSADGWCRPFDADASGTVGGSGVVAVVLRRLSDVPPDAETHGVILGSAVNNDGFRKVGFSAPSQAGQTAVIRAALEAGDVAADTLGYLETHGTGTYVGDPIEWASTSAALRDAGVSGRIAVGAVKANIGHLDATAGLASLVKTLLSVKRGQIPPVANFHRLNPLLAGIDSPLYVPTASAQWRGDEPRRAAINSFGIGGTNAHVIVEEPAAVTPRTSPGPDRPSIVVLSSVRTHGTDLGAVRLAEHLSAHDVSPVDVAHTLRVGRTPLPQRLAVVGRTRAELIEALQDDCSPRRLRGTSRRLGPRPLVVLLPGQGTQRPGMASSFRELLPGFAPAVEECLGHLDAVSAPIVRQALWDQDFPAERLNETVLAQPALFVLQYAAVRALDGLGVRADAYAGHSLGEVTAACLSGALDLSAALDLVTRRAAAMEAGEPGAMLAVTCGEDEARALCGAGPCEVAAVNSADGCVLSGPVAAIEDLQRRAGTRIPHSRLHTTRAFHSAAMEPAAAALRAHLAGRTGAPVRTPFVGNRDGVLIPAGTRIPLDMLADSVRATVRFADGVTSLAAAFPDAIAVEIGPGRTLSSMVAAAGLTVPPPAAAGPDELARTVAWLWANGQPVDLAPLVPVGRLLHLPVTVFGGERHVAPEAEWPTTTPEAPGTDRADLPAAQPASPAELITDAWRKLLGVADLGPESDFYALGGDSLVTVDLLRRVEQAYGIEVSLRDLVLARLLGEQIRLVERRLEAKHE